MGSLNFLENCEQDTNIMNANSWIATIVCQHNHVSHWYTSYLTHLNILHLDFIDMCLIKCGSEVKYEN